MCWFKFHLCELAVNNLSQNMVAKQNNASVVLVPGANAEVIDCNVRVRNIEFSYADDFMISTKQADANTTWRKTVVFAERLDSGRTRRSRITPETGERGGGMHDTLQLRTFGRLGNRGDRQKETR